MLIAGGLFLLCFTSAAAKAQDTLSPADKAEAPKVSAQPYPPMPKPNTMETVDILPAKSLAGTDYKASDEESTHPMIRLTPDKSQIVRLDGKAATIIVGNPAHLNVLADSQETLVLVPRAPGASYFTVLDDASNIIMQRHVIIASPKKKYVRIRRSCAGSEESCQATQIYYCPDMCHEVLVNSDAEAPETEGMSAGQGGEAAQDMQGAIPGGAALPAEGAP